jgi:cell shape-determining protein MreC
MNTVIQLDAQQILMWILVFAAVLLVLVLIQLFIVLYRTSKILYAFQDILDVVQLIMHIPVKFATSFLTNVKDVFTKEEK